MTLPIPLDWFPRINAALNAVAGVLLVVALIHIRRGRIDAHRRVMLSAFAVSVVFLVSYLTYHTLRQAAEGVGHTRWVVDTWLRPTYYAVLVSHVILAAAVPVLAILTLRLGLKRQDDRHRRLARWTWPIWMYVSVTGVVVYAMIYEVQPRLVAAGAPVIATEGESDSGTGTDADPPVEP